jgi:hypothetical protein
MYGEVLYTLQDRGFFTAHDARTGREIYGRQRIAPDATGFTSSPWAYNGKIFVMSEDGDAYVLQAGPEGGDRRQPHRSHGLEAVPGLGARVTDSPFALTTTRPARRSHSLAWQTPSGLYRSCRRQSNFHEEEKRHCPIRTIHVWACSNARPRKVLKGCFANNYR